MRKLLILLQAFCLSLALPPSARAAEPPPLSAYGALPEVEDMALSLGATRLAAITTVNGKRQLLIMDAGLRPLRTMVLDDIKVRSIDWIGEDRVLLRMSQTEDLGYGFTADQAEISRAFIIPADPSQEMALVFSGNRSIIGAVFGSYGQRRSADGWTGYFGGVELTGGPSDRYAPHFRPALFAVDLASNRVRRVANPGHQGQDVDWLLAPDGTVAATFTIDRDSGRWTLAGPDDKRLAQGTSPQGDAGLVSLGAEGRSVIYSDVDAEAERTVWFEVALDGSAPPAEFLADEDIDRLFIDRTTGRMLGFMRGGASAAPEFFSKEHEAIVKKVYRAFGRLKVRLVDWTPDFSHVLVQTSGNRDSGSWYLVDVAKLRAEGIGVERLAIAPEHVGPISTVAYTAADGLELDGILTLPPDREAKNLPLVMLPHGGPHAYDEEAFDWWAQAFASRGYAVFQPNFRGSTNRDSAFVRAGYGEWGRKMQTDISDGLAALVSKGIVDPQRACIVGASYGGYAALAGVTLQQGLYRCSVAVAGVSDLSLMYRTDYRESGQAGLLRRSLLEELGPRSGFEAASPRRFAAQADAPILLIHGREDTVVPYEQSAKMADALKDAGKPYRLIDLGEEDHWLSRSATRMQMLEATMAFVQEHNPAD
ncbi:MAG TPA: alpha/beta fold hydrolase [Croceibacterium sp.]